MCMGYAKDIKAWVCPQEIGRREHSLERWGEMIRAETDPLGQPVRLQQGAPTVTSWRAVDAIKFDAAT